MTEEEVCVVDGNVEAPHENVVLHIHGSEEENGSRSAELVVVKKRRKRSRGPKKYQVLLGESRIYVIKSSPVSAARSAIRGYIKQLPLMEHVKVYVKSSRRVHCFDAVRNYDNKKHRRFCLRREGPALYLKKMPSDHNVPAMFL